MISGQHCLDYGGKQGGWGQFTRISHSGSGEASFTGMLMFSMGVQSSLEAQEERIGVQDGSERLCTK